MLLTHNFLFLKKHYELCWIYFICTSTSIPRYFPDCSLLWDSDLYSVLSYINSFTLGFCSASKREVTEGEEGGEGTYFLPSTTLG